MCNLYRLHAGNAAIAQMFAAVPGPVRNRGDEVYPGYPGLVIAAAQMRTMTWGFPVVLKGRQGQPLKPKPVTNARDDKLHTPFWAAHFRQRRCLIPLDHWAEPAGEARRMTRTWYSPAQGNSPAKGNSPAQGGTFAVAGIWRPTQIWGDTYAMVMVAANPQMAPLHDRMPVILRREDWPVWTDGDPAQAFDLCRPWPGDLIVARSTDRWGGPGVAAPLGDHPPVTTSALDPAPDLFG